jgi:hypothetical protein
VMVTVALTVSAKFPAAVAVMVTVLPLGTKAGAVYVVGASLAVCAGWNEPHFELPQVTVQSTPRFLGSFKMEALTVATALVARDAGGGWVREITGGVRVTWAMRTLLVSALAVAEIVTGVSFVTAGGAVNVVAESLAVWAGFREPHGGAPQVTIQSTPAFEASLETVTRIGTWVPVTTEAGGGGLKAMEIWAPVISTVALTVWLWSALAVAVIVTALPAGTIAGAVKVAAEPLAV